MPATPSTAEKQNGWKGFFHSFAPAGGKSPSSLEDRASRHARDGDDAALHSQIHGPIHNQSRTQSHSSRYAGTGGSGRGARIASYHLTTATSASTSAATSASPRATSPFAGAPTPIEAFLQQCQDHSSPSPEKSLDHWGWEAQDSLSDDALADRSLRSSWASGEPAADGEERDNTVAPPPPPPAPPPPSRGSAKSIPKPPPRRPPPPQFPPPSPARPPPPASISHMPPAAVVGSQGTVALPAPGQRPGGAAEEFQGELSDLQYVASNNNLAEGSATVETPPPGRKGKPPEQPKVLDSPMPGDPSNAEYDARVARAEQAAVQAVLGSLQSCAASGDADEPREAGTIKTKGADEPSKANKDGKNHKKSAAESANAPGPSPTSSAAGSAAPSLSTKTNSTAAVAAKDASSEPAKAVGPMQSAMVKDLKEAARKAQSEAAEAAKEVIKLKGEAAALTKETEKHKEQVKGLESNMGYMQKKLKTAEDALAKSVKDHKQKLSEQAEEMHKLVSQVEDAKRQSTSDQTKLSSKDSELRQMNQALLEAKAEIDRHKMAAEKCNQEIASLKEALEAKQRELQAAAADQELLPGLRAELETAHAEASAQSKKLQDMRRTLGDAEGVQRALEEAERVAAALSGELEKAGKEAAEASRTRAREAEERAESHKFELFLCERAIQDLHEQVVSGHELLQDIEALRVHIDLAESVCLDEEIPKSTRSPLRLEGASGRPASPGAIPDGGLSLPSQPISLLDQFATTPTTRETDKELLSTILTLDSRPPPLVTGEARATVQRAAAWVKRQLLASRYPNTNISGSVSQESRVADEDARGSPRGGAAARGTGASSVDWHARGGEEAHGGATAEAEDTGTTQRLEAELELRNSQMEQLERELHRIAQAARTEKERREASKLEWEQEKVVLQRRVVAAESAASSPHTVGRLDRSSREAHHANGGGLESFLQDPSEELVPVGLPQSTPAPHPYAPNLLAAPPSIQDHPAVGLINAMSPPPHNPAPPNEDSQVLQQISVAKAEMRNFQKSLEVGAWSRSSPDVRPTPRRPDESHAAHSTLPFYTPALALYQTPLPMGNSKRENLATRNPDPSYSANPTSANASDWQQGGEFALGTRLPLTNPSSSLSSSRVDRTALVDSSVDPTGKRNAFASSWRSAHSRDVADQAGGQRDSARGMTNGIGSSANTSFAHTLQSLQNEARSSMPMGKTTGGAGASWMLEMEQVKNKATSSSRQDAAVASTIADHAEAATNSMHVRKIDELLARLGGSATRPETQSRRVG